MVLRTKSTIISENTLGYSRLKRAGRGYPEGYIISTKLEGHYIWCDISKEKDILNKLEFGRYLSPGKPEYKRKMTSWTKGVFVNDDKCNVRFMQTSWDGEKGDIYKAVFNTQNKQSVTTFLSIPIAIGWTEIDYKLDNEKYYKSAGQAMLNGQQYQNTFILKDIGEQDIPFILDRFDQFLRTRWADCFINNFRRNIDKIKVLPVRPYDKC